MQLKCIVVEDDPWAFELIKRYVNKIPFLSLQQTMYDPAEAGRLLLNNEADLLFIDISAPSCAELLSTLVTKPITIFTSVYKRYAWSGFEYGALDFLLKPFDFERFSKAVARAAEFFKFIHYSKQEDSEYLYVRSGYSMVKISLNEIEYIEGLIDYIRIHLAHSKPVLTLMSLKSIMEKLPSEKFKRIHRSYIVAVSQIMSVKNNKVVLFSAAELPVSRTYKLFGRELNNGI